MFFRERGGFDDWASKYWILRGALDAHVQKEKGWNIRSLKGDVKAEMTEYYLTAGTEFCKFMKDWMQ